MYKSGRVGNERDLVRVKLEFTIQVRSGMREIW